MQTSNSNNDSNNDSNSNNDSKSKYDEVAQIKKIFDDKVRDVPLNLDGQNASHSGKYGHKLEKLMGIKHNSKNAPDFPGWEMKTGDSVTTFVDKAPDTFYVDGIKIPSRQFAKHKQAFFVKYACAKSTDVPTMGGWSYKKYNHCGQRLCTDDNHNVYIIYDWAHDKRENKDELDLNKTPHPIMRWNADSLKNAIEKKFNEKGFFKCIKENNAYVKICFGKPITFATWIDELKKGIIYHDGYSKPKGRWRHVFRAKNTFWDSLITEVY
jgi:hypothetical protein